MTATIRLLAAILAFGVALAPAVRAQTRAKVTVF